MNVSTKLITVLSAAVALVATLPPNASRGQDEQFQIQLGGYKFVPGVNDPELGNWKMPQREGDQADLYLVQLRGATRQVTIDQLKDRRLKVVQYIHPYTYVVWGHPQDHRSVRELDDIRWVGEFQPGYRVTRNLLEQNRAEELMEVLIYRGADVDQVIRQLSQLGARLEGQESISNKFVLAQFTAPVNAVREMAQVRGIYSIQKKPTDGGLRSEMSCQLNAGNTTGNTAIPGYQVWLNTMGINGKGVIIANVDGGLDNQHPDLKNRLISCTGTTCQNAMNSDHGTHTAGIMAGDGSSGVQDAHGFVRGMGVAPAAQLVEQVYINFMSPAGMSELMTQSVRNGAYISGNSWGPSGSPQGYDASTLQVDVRVRDADPQKDGNEYLLFVLSIMNGNGGTSSQGTPDEAKNIFTIGSTKMQAVDGSQIQEIDDISSNSAHGPCLDGRTIPHMVAPGCRVDSTTSGGGHGLMCGTSMSSPQVSGATALFVQKYRQLMSGQTPSPALIKAAFIAVAKNLHGNKDADGNTLGHPFDNKQGWGRMDLRAVLDVTTSSVQYFDEPKILQDTGDNWTVKLEPVDGDKPVRIMLAWTDAPGHGLGGSTPAWNNDLDLAVETGGKKFLGNVFGANGYSEEGASPDGKNNTEGVFFRGTPVGKGTLTVTVKGANINSDGVPNNDDDTDQDFALVCYNCRPVDLSRPAPIAIDDAQDLPMSRRLASNPEMNRRINEPALAVGDPRDQARTVCDEDTRQRVSPPAADAERATCCLVLKFPGSEQLYQGTGFIVAKRLVATAGHCVYDHRLGGWVQWVAVIPGSNESGSQPFGAYDGTYAHSVRGWTESGDARYDYGAIEVGNNTMHEKVNSILELAVLKDSDLMNGNVHALGYPVDKSPGRSQWASLPKVSFDSVLPLQLSYSFDTFGGNSGGPVFHSSANNRVVGIHTRGGCPNSGTRLTEIRRQTILEDFNPDARKWSLGAADSGGGNGAGNGTARLDLDCDCDRTGQVDGSDAEEQAEESRSAILINNCDRDGAVGSGGPDNHDSVINGMSDRNDLEPLILRQQSGLAGANVRIQMSGNLSDGVPLLRRVRVFGPNGDVVLGASAGDSYVLPSELLNQLASGDLTFLVEGLSFATSVDITISKDEVVHDQVRLEVAPFVLTPHVLMAKKNYVVETSMPISQRYVQDFTAACNTAGVQPVVVRSGDIWIEDELTWGYTESPRVRIPVAMHMFRLRPLQAKVAELLGPDVGWFQPFPYPPNPPTDLHLNYGGNVEVTPPSADHPFGCVYYGGHVEASSPQHIYFVREFDSRLRQFFHRQCVQPVLELHTNWLSVGHIDELVSFVPDGNGKGVLVASSPKRAYQLLSQLDPSQPLDSRYALAFNVATVGDLFTKPTLQQTMEEFNREVDRRIFGLDHSNPDPQSVVGMLINQLNLSPSSVLEVPTVFTNEHPSTWAAVALTPGVVNLSSMGKHSLLPDPFLAEFKSDTQSVLQSVGQTPLWIDNWGLYHVNMGEVHCGSNELRDAFSKKWWEL